MHPVLGNGRWLTSCVIVFLNYVYLEIKEVKKRKERARELEGIDTSNIVTSSRRRSMTSFLPPPKPKMPEVSDNSDKDSGDDDADDGESDDDDKENNNDDGQSEEANEGKSS